MPSVCDGILQRNVIFNHISVFYRLTLVTQRRKEMMSWMTSFQVNSISNRMMEMEMAMMRIKMTKTLLMRS